MNTEELNVWIAEKLGWKLQPDEWVFENPEAKVYERNGEFKTDSDFRYTSDLNACHEMEKSLEPLIQREKYPEILAQVVAEHEGFRSNGLPLPSFHLVTATAHQRCLAFYRTMGGKE